MKKYILLIIFLFAAVSRFINLDHPSQSYFDEVYHLPAVRLIAANDLRAYEWWHEPIAEVSSTNNYHDWLHPPLAKLIQAGFLIILGDHAFSWRLPPALAGLNVVIVLYFLAKRVFLQVFSKTEAQNMAVLTSFLTTVSGLLLVQSRIMMNDIFLLLWLLLALLMLLRWQPQLLVWKLDLRAVVVKKCCKNPDFYLLLAGLCFGLAIATKWSAVFLWLVCFLLIFLLAVLKKVWRKLPLIIFSLLLVPVAVYLTSYSQMFFQGKSLSDFFALHQQIIWYQTHRSEGHPYASTPINWFLNTRSIWYWTDLRLTADDQQTGNIYLLENPGLHLTGVAAVIFFSFLIVKESIVSNKQQQTLSQQTKLMISLLGLYAVTWLPWFFAPRVMFYFHYLPALPFLFLIAAVFLQAHLKSYSQVSYRLLLLLIFIAFLAFYPHWIGLPVFKTWSEVIYLAVPTWQ